MYWLGEKAWKKNSTTVAVSQERMREGMALARSLNVRRLVAWSLPLDFSQLKTNY
jgi:hypothetical protein